MEAENKPIIKLLEIVKGCGELFMAGYHADKSVRHKGTVDLVTEYDVAIEKRLSAELAHAFGEYTIVGEESTTAIVHPEKAIYIDPIDGTTNFVHGLPHCAISVGVWEGGRPVMGVVYNPVLEECFYAVRGEGAYCNGQKMAVSSQESFQQSLMATGFPYTKVEKGDDYQWVLRTMAAMLPATRDIRRLGSASIDLCYVAWGKFDAFYECNLKPWDVAAGILIVEEAGGEITNEKGGAYSLDDHIIAASNSKVHGQLVSCLLGENAGLLALEAAYDEQLYYTGDELTLDGLDHEDAFAVIDAVDKETGLFTAGLLTSTSGYYEYPGEDGNIYDESYTVIKNLNTLSREQLEHFALVFERAYLKLF